MFGSTGKLYAQIKNGAPFDVFFAADVKRPRLLEEDGLGLPGSRFTYAIGKLVLWSLKAAYVDDRGEVIEEGDFRHLALANPRLAPYGMAARQVLQRLDLWDRLAPRMVRGESAGQTYQFVASGSAELGFVARSQVTRPETPLPGSFWTVPEALHDPIDQQAVQLADRPAVKSFMELVRSAEGRVGGRIGQGVSDSVTPGVRSSI